MAAAVLGLGNPKWAERGQVLRVWDSKLLPCGQGAERDAAMASPPRIPLACILVWAISSHESPHEANAAGETPHWPITDQGQAASPLPTGTCAWTEMGTTQGSAGGPGWLLQFGRSFALPAACTSSCSTPSWPTTSCAYGTGRWKAPFCYGSGAVQPFQGTCTAPSAR